MELEGVVTNIVAFGAFVDVGVHQDGLVHVSQLADRYVSDPNAVVRVGQKVNVRVLSVDLGAKSHRADDEEGRSRTTTGRTYRTCTTFRASRTCPASAGTVISTGADPKAW